MEKVRIHELAKKLNTTSKRLTEKLKEIGIEVKSHMSLLEDDELKALYDHIGIKHTDHAEKEPKKQDASTSSNPPGNEKKEHHHHDKLISRRVQVIIDTKKDRNESPGNTKFKRATSVTESSGLRQGYTHDPQAPKKKTTPKGAGPKNNAKKQDSSFSAEDKTNIISETETIKKGSSLLGEEISFKNDIEKNDNFSGEKTTKALKKDSDSPGKSAKTKDVKEPKDKNVVKSDSGDIKTIGGSDSLENLKSQGIKGSDIQTESMEKVKKQPDKEINHAAEQGIIEESKLIDNPDRGSSAGDNADREKITGQNPGQDSKKSDYRQRGGNSAGGKDNRQRNDNTAGRSGYQQRNNNTGGGGYQQRSGQGGYQQRNNNTGGGGYQQRSGNQAGSGGYQQRSGQGGYQQRNNNTGGGGYQQRSGNQAGGYQQRSGQGGYQQRNNNSAGGGGYQQRGNNTGYQNKKSTMDVSIDEPLIREPARKDYANKRLDKTEKPDTKRDNNTRSPAANTGKNRRNRTQDMSIVGQTKGINEVLSEDFILDQFYDDSDALNKKLLRQQKLRRQQRKAKEKYIPPRAVLTKITIGEIVTVKELAEALKKTSTEVIKKLMAMGVMATLNQELDFDTATLIADEFGIKTEKAVIVNEEDILFDESEDTGENLLERPPVVVVMGHVDHGKTSLLDAIRETKAVAGEAGGITQHIGAYIAKINDKNITFLDTPGHEAFTAMRARGAQVTDIAILVVAADDGVMPQTIEAINHAKDANVSIIVAVNKIDKAGANPDKVKQELADNGVLIEEWGGDVICVPVSAKKRENIDQLLEMILLTADVLELKADYKKQPKGTVIESKLDKSRGPVATVLVQRGTLSVGDSIVTGTTVGRIRAMVDDKGESIKEATPSTPVEILGLSEVPSGGEIFYAIEDEKVAKNLAEKRRIKIQDDKFKEHTAVTLEGLFDHIKEGKMKELKLIVKADVQGSVEAVKQSLLKLSNDEVRVKVIHGAAGAVTSSDVSLAQVANAIIIGFNVRPGQGVDIAAENADVDLRFYSIIYDAINDVEAAMKGMLDPIYKEVVTGHVEIRAIFKVSGVGTIGGAYVTDGKVNRNSKVRVVREGIVLHDGSLASLKRFKDDVKDVSSGYECGISIEKYNDIKEGDIIEVYVMEEIKR